MSNAESLAPLKKTCESLKKIQETLTPFLKLIDQYHEQQQSQSGSTKSNSDGDTSSQKIDLYQITEAEAAIAMSIGTLRYMALRLKGQKSSKGGSNNDSKSDPLRMELDKIRKTLVNLRKLKKKVNSSTPSKKNNIEETKNGAVEKGGTRTSSSKKRKSDQFDKQDTDDNNRRKK